MVRWETIKRKEPAAGRRGPSNEMPLERFLQQLGGKDVGDIELEPSDNLRRVKLRLRRAASRLGLDLEIWTTSGHLYVRRTSKQRDTVKGRFFTKKDPLWRLAGAGKSGYRDVSENKPDHLVEAYASDSE
jgi:hypothetical protein